LFATDFGPETERTARFAFALAQEHRARLTMLHMIQEAKGHKEPGEEQTESAVDKMEQLVPPGAENWCKAECRASLGGFAREILTFARETNADLIVMGAEARNASVDPAAISVAYHVVAKSQCPVLTVRRRLEHAYAASRGD
jgi:nucleotide-binding universal stress UspA family protein